jgi:hypothetical protein
MGFGPKLRFEENARCGLFNTTVDANGVHHIVYLTVVDDGQIVLAHREGRLQGDR